MDIFAQASQQKLRFSGMGKGSLTTEDLWDLPVEVLNEGAILLDEHISKIGQQGYLRTKSTADTAITLRRDILVYIITEKLNQQDASANTRAISIKQKELAQLIHAKKMEQLAAKSLEQLQLEYDALTADK